LVDAIAFPLNSTSNQNAKPCRGAGENRKQISIIVITIQYFTKFRIIMSVNWIRTEHCEINKQSSKTQRPITSEKGRTQKVTSHHRIELKLGRYRF